MVTANPNEVREGSSHVVIVIRGYKNFESTYECRVILCPEEEGGFSAHALRLPGVVSQGDTIDEALENVADAFRGAVQVYQDSAQKIPWQDVEIDHSKDTLERWILVDI